MNKYISILILILLIPVGTNAYQREGKCILGDCISGSGTWDFENGIVYHGQFNNRSFEGSGELSDSNLDTRYIGQFKNDQPNGMGTFKFADGTIYEGEFLGATLIKGYIIEDSGRKIKVNRSVEEIARLKNPQQNVISKPDETSDIYFYFFIAVILTGFALLYKLLSYFGDLISKRNEANKTSYQKLRDKMLFMNLFALKRSGKIKEKDHAAYDAIVDERNRTIKS